MQHTYALIGVAAAVLAAAPARAQAPAASPRPAPAASPAAAPLPGVDEIIGKHVAARGGLDKLKGIQSLRMAGKMTMGPGIEAPVTVEVKRPQRMRMEVQLQGMTAVQAFDGGSGWMIMPFGGRTEPQPMSPDELKEAEEMSDIDGPLVDYKAKGHAVELLGKETVEGTETYKLKVTLKSGDVRYVYLDTENFMEIRSEGKRKVRGSEMEIETSFGDFKEVGGVMFPHAVEGGPKGMPQRQKIAIEKIDVNPALEDTRFKMPAAAPSPAAPKK